MITQEWIDNNREAISYLFKLQQSGRTNMFGAVQYMVAELGIDRIEARDILTEWMTNYDKLSAEFGY